jgi:hypothetical protein
MMNVFLSKVLDSSKLDHGNGCRKGAESAFTVSVVK